MQLTVRMPEEYSKKLESLSRKMGLKRSDIIRLALKQFLAKKEENVYSSPFRKVSHLLGAVESGIKDLGQRHRHYLIQNDQWVNERD